MRTLDLGFMHTYKDAAHTYTFFAMTYHLKFHASFVYHIYCTFFKIFFYYFLLD